MSESMGGYFAIGTQDRLQFSFVVLWEGGLQGRIVGRNKSSTIVVVIKRNKYKTTNHAETSETKRT